MICKSIKCSFLLDVFTRFLLIGFYLMFVSGCAKTDFTDLKHYIKEVNSRPKGTVKPLPEIKVVETFIFQPEGLRDPFQPTEISDEFDEYGVDGLRPDKTRRKEELESFALSTLQMVGTVLMQSELWGLVRVSDGSNTVYRVRVGNYMGRNNGKIIRITENSIELMEIVPDKKKSGVWQEQQASLVLAE